MLLGYARVSTDDQNLDLQKDALKSAGCEQIFEDKISGSKFERPGLAATIQYAREGDTIVIWRLDRLGRSLKDLIDLVEKLNSNKIGLKSLQESLDTSSSSGQLIFHIFASLAQFERNLIRERTLAGLSAARARGRMGGRQKKLSATKQRMAVDLYNKKTHSINQICEEFDITKPTLYKYIAATVNENLRICNSSELA